MFAPDGGPVPRPEPRSIGVQWIADLGDCVCDPTLLQQAAALEAMSLAAVGESGLVAVGGSFHQFQPAGATGVVLLAESHLAIHTWPELRFVAVDLYICNFFSDNTEKAQRLFDRLLQILKPGHFEHRRVDRNGVSSGSLDSAG